MILVEAMVSSPADNAAVYSAPVNGELSNTVMVML